MARSALVAWRRGRGGGRLGGGGRAGRAVPRDGPGSRRRGGARGAAAAGGSVTPPGGGRAAWGRGPAAMEGVLYKWTNYLSGELLSVLSLGAGRASRARPSSSFIDICLCKYMCVLSPGQRCPLAPPCTPLFQTCCHIVTGRQLEGGGAGIVSPTRGCQRWSGASLALPPPGPGVGWGLFRMRWVVPTGQRASPFCTSP